MHRPATGARGQRLVGRWREFWAPCTPYATEAHSISNGARDVQRASWISASAERLLVIVLVLLRTLALIQSIPELVIEHSKTPNMWAFTTTFVVFALWSGFYMAWILRARTIRVPTAGRIDLIASCAVLLICGLSADLTIPLTAGWLHWALTLIAPVAVYAGALPHRSERIAAASALVIACSTPVLLTSSPVDLFAASSHVLALPAQTAAGYYIAAYLSSLSAWVEDARAEAAREATEAEVARHRALLHDQATILGFIARGVDDDRLADAIKQQAAAESRKIDAFLRGNHDSPTVAETAPQSLSGITRAVAAAFPDLDPVVTTDLARSTLTRPAATAVSEALTTLLHNVRLHSKSSECVLHAETTNDTWEVSVADNGVGFNPVTTPWRFGLSQLVHANCHRHGIEVEIRSQPGSGTFIALRGSRDTLMRAASHASGRGEGDYVNFDT